MKKVVTGLFLVGAGGFVQAAQLTKAAINTELRQLDTQAEALWEGEVNLKQELRGLMQTAAQLEKRIEVGRAEGGNLSLQQRAHFHVLQRENEVIRYCIADLNQLIRKKESDRSSIIDRQASLLDLFSRAV